MEYLGHVLTPDGLKPNPALVSAVREFPVPTCLKELRRFLGLASYYRRFIPKFASIAQSLHHLTCKDVPFIWTEAATSAFQELKERLTTSPVLAYPSFDQDLVLETDASISGLGAVLAQVQSDGKLHPIAYASRSLSPPEKNYSVTELETLAVVWAMSNFHYYLYGHRVKVYTDHTAVRAVLDAPNLTGKHARWWTRVYGKGVKEVQIVYRAGKDNKSADALSRAPQNPTPPPPCTSKETPQIAAVSVKPVDEFSELPKEPDCDLLNLPNSFAKEQRKDKTLNEIFKFKKDGTLPSNRKRAHTIATQDSRFQIENEILYYLDPEQDGRKRAVVPQHLRDKVMRETRGGPFSGHFSG